MSKREEVRIGKDCGRVKVYVRIRPFSKEEVVKKAQSSLDISEETSQICVQDSRNKSEKIYQFDHVFPSSKTNQQVCEQLSKPIVNSALNGFNGTLMAYGQTGTGKTHTLMANDGITQDVINKVFDHIHGDRKHEFKISASYLQIYQEKIHDLLNINNKVELNIRENPKAGIYVENLTEYVVRSPSEAFSLISFGKRRLVFAETKMNRTSSRSHSVFQLTIEKAPRKEKHGAEDNTNKETKKLKCKKELKAEGVVQLMDLDDDVIVRGKIHLCDLAGSERVKKTHAAGERLSEAQHINSSLLELGNVIQALASNKQTHVPFRNSVLTRLLQESLGGNCKTSLIVCISPGLKDMSETKSTLNFGSRAMKITNTAYVNMEVDFKRLSDSLLEKLELQEHELQNLRLEYNKLKEIDNTKLLGKVEQMSQESEKFIASLQNCHQKQVEEYLKEIEDLNNQLESKGKRISKLESELHSINAGRMDEDRIAKILLLSEITSLELLAANGFSAWAERSEGKMDENREKTVMGLLQHCEWLLKFSPFVLQNSSHSNGIDAALPDLLSDGHSLMGLAKKGDVSKKCDGNEIVKQQEDFKSLLIESKLQMEEQISQIFENQNSHFTDTTEIKRGQSNLLDLCMVLIDKAFLASHISLENHELRKKMAKMIDQNEMKRNKMEEEFQNTEKFAERIKKAFEEQIDVDEKFSGFEFTLSKIEDILADEKTTKECKTQMNENSSNSIKINREELAARRSVRVGRRKSSVQKNFGSKVGEQTQKKVDDVELKASTPNESMDLNEKIDTSSPNESMGLNEKIDTSSPNESMGLNGKIDTPSPNESMGLNGKIGASTPNESMGLNGKIDAQTQTMQRKIKQENFEICDEKQATDLNETVTDSKRSNMVERKVSNPLNDWLLQLSNDPISDQNSTGRPSPYTAKDFNIMTAEATSRSNITVEKVNNEEDLGNGQMKNGTSFIDWDLFEENEDKRLSGIISGAAEMTNEINMYLKVESEIESVKSEIEKRHLSKKGRIKKKRGKDRKDDKIREKRGKTSQGEKILLNDHSTTCEDNLPVYRNIGLPPAGRSSGLTKSSRTTPLLRGKTKEGSTMITGVTKQTETQTSNEIQNGILPLISKPTTNLNPFCLQCQPYHQQIYCNPLLSNCYHGNQTLRLGSSEQPGSFCDFHKIFEQTSTPIQSQIMCFCATDQGVVQRSVLAGLDQNKTFDNSFQVGCLVCNKAETQSCDRLPVDKFLKDILKPEDARKSQDGKKLDRIKSEMSFETETSSDSGFCIQDGSVEKPDSNNESKEMINCQGPVLGEKESFVNDLGLEFDFRNEGEKDALNKESFTKRLSQNIDQGDSHKRSNRVPYQNHDFSSSNNKSMEASAACRDNLSFSKRNGGVNDGNESMTSDEELDQRLGNLFEEVNENDQYGEESKTGPGRVQGKGKTGTYQNEITVGTERVWEEGDSKSTRKIQGHKSTDVDKTNKTPNHQKLIREACNSLEVQIASGYDDNRYGDSFLSPLVKDDSFDMVEEDESRVLTDELGSLDVTTGSQSEDIVVKKSWSISNWLWGKRSRQPNIEEVSVVIQ